MGDHALREAVGLDPPVERECAERRDEPPVRPDRASDQPLAGEVVEPAGAAVPLSRGEHERQVAGAAGFAEALRERDDELLGNGDPDESTDRQRVTIDDQPGGRLGRDDLRAPPSRHGATLTRVAVHARRLPSEIAVAGRSPRLDPLDWPPALDSQSHVEHDAAVCHASDGVEVRLDHLWELPEQEGKAQHQLAQRLSVEHSAAAEPVQLSGDALGGVDQLVGFCVRYWQQAERSRSAKAGPATAEADREHWAQIGIADRPHQHVRPAGRDEALDDRSDPFPSGRVHPSFELAPARSHRRLILQPEHHSVDVARMRGSGKVRLQRHRSADFRCHRNRALEIAAAMRGDNRDPVRGQQSFRLRERKPAARGLAIKK